MNPEHRLELEQRRSEIGIVLLEHMKNNPDELVKDMLDYYADIRNSLDVCHEILSLIRRGIQDGHVVITDSDLKKQIFTIFF